MTASEYNLCVDEYSDGVYRFVLKNIRDEERARDIVQDAFVKMWEKSGDINYQKAKSYLFTTAYHTMIDVIRKEKKQELLDEKPANEPFHERNYSDLNEVLEQGLKRLPEVQKNVLLLRDYEGYSYQEIGKIINLSEAQVKVYIYRARVTLKKYIGSMDAVI
ncbi:MAG: RNA polymerase sigma factor [Bacteroidales bacterium]